MSEITPIILFLLSSIPEGGTAVQCYSTPYLGIVSLLYFGVALTLPDTARVSSRQWTPSHRATYLTLSIPDLAVLGASYSIMRSVGFDLLFVLFPCTSFNDHVLSYAI